MSPTLRPGESWEPGALSPLDCIAEVCDRAGYTHLGTMAGRQPLREWLQRRDQRSGWPMTFRDGFTSEHGPALVDASINGAPFPQYLGSFPLYREGAQP